MFRFLKSIGQEMKEVDWPNFRQLRHDSAGRLVDSIILKVVYLNGFMGIILL